MKKLVSFIAKGQRLERLDIEDGELCVFDTTIQPNPGDVVLCRINGMEGLQMKRLVQTTGALHLVESVSFEKEQYGYAATQILGVLVKTFIPNVTTKASKRSKVFHSIPTLTDDKAFYSRKYQYKEGG